MIIAPFWIVTCSILYIFPAENYVPQASDDYTGEILTDKYPLQFRRGRNYNWTINSRPNKITTIT